MSNVVDLDSRKPHKQGPAKCIACQAEWIAVAPVGTVWLECPQCKMQMGRSIGPTCRDGAHWHCLCGNDLFFMTPDSIYCACCGEPQQGF